MQHQKICSEWFAVIFFFWKPLFFRLHKVKSYFLFPFLFFPHLLFWVGWWGFKGLEQDFARKSLRGIVGWKVVRIWSSFLHVNSFRGGVGVGGGFNTINMKGNKNVCKQIFHLVRYYTEIWIIGYIFTYVIFFV